MLCKTSAGPVDFEERGLSCKHSNRIRVRQCNNEEPRNSKAPGRASIASEPHEFIILRLQCSCGGPSLEFRSRLTELIQGNSTSEQATNRQRATNPWYDKERDSLWSRTMKSYLLACSRSVDLELVRLGLDIPHHEHSWHRVSVISACSRPEFLMKGGAACSLRRSGKK